MKGIVVVVVLRGTSKSNSEVFHKVKSSNEIMTHHDRSDSDIFKIISCA